jgi:hypothetical protein
VRFLQKHLLNVLKDKGQERFKAAATKVSNAIQVGNAMHGTRPFPATHTPSHQEIKPVGPEGLFQVLNPLEHAK